MPSIQRNSILNAFLGATLTPAISAWAVAGTAADLEICDNFSAQSDGSQRHVTFVDHEPEGVSIGDQRVGYRSVIDGDGNEIGEYRWIATVVEIGGSDDQLPATSATGVFNFSDGSIFTIRPAAPTFVGPGNVGEIAGQGDI